VIKLLLVSFVTGLALGIGFAIPIAIVLKWYKEEVI